MPEPVGVSPGCQGQQHALLDAALSAMVDAVVAAGWKVQSVCLFGDRRLGSCTACRTWQETHPASRILSFLYVATAVT